MRERGDSMKRTDVWERLSDHADLPGETAPGMPVVELAGDRRVLIEHHKGVTSYSAAEIGVRVSYGEVVVRGECLELTRMTKEQLIITGCIQGIALCRRRRT